MSERFTLAPVDTVIQARFSDTDAMGHVSSGSYAAWAEVGRADFFIQLGKTSGRQADIPWFVLVNLSLDFHAEGKYGQHFEMTTRCTRLGGKSMTLQQKVFADEKLCCTVTVVMACFDQKTRKSIPLPDWWEIPE